MWLIPCAAMNNARDDERFQCADGVKKIAACGLRVGNARWAFADENAAAIDAHWKTAARDNPNYFNGGIYLVDGVTAKDDTVNATLLRTDFKSYLYWRASGFPDADVLDGFGSALMRTSDGDVMLGRQRAGNVNGGLTYAPAGFIDADDVDPDGRIPIARSARREAVEETGIEPGLLVQEQGLYLTRSGAQLSFGVPFRVLLSTTEFMRRASAHIAASANSELEAMIAVSASRDVATLSMPRYMRSLLRALLTED